MNMAKTQDLPLNPSKVSGVCGRLLCCLSYENEQYKQMKAMELKGVPANLQGVPAREKREAHWIRPQLVLLTRGSWPADLKSGVSASLRRSPPNSL